MTTHRTQGFSLLELLVVVSITAMLATGAAVMFRTVRQTSDLANSRREALQNARAAVERLARRVRCAKKIASISAPDDPSGSVSITDFNGDNRVFSLVGSELRYGIGSADSLLAKPIQSLRFQGYDHLGAVPYTDPSRIQSLEISLTASLPGGSATFDLKTRVLIRSGAIRCRCFTSYAATVEYQDKMKDAAYGLGVPDGLFSAFNGDSAQVRYGGFDPGTFTGTIHHISAGIFMFYKAGGLQVVIRHGSTELFNETYDATELDHIKGKWNWWWIDFTYTQASWTEADVGVLSVQLGAPGSNVNCQFDSVAVRAFFDPPLNRVFWADRQGAGTGFPNEWINVGQALGSPDASYATGVDAPVGDDQCFRVSVPDLKGEILTARACINGYITATTSGKLVVGAAVPAAAGIPIPHYLTAGDLNPFAGGANQGDILCDLTTDREWTFTDLNDYEIRVSVDTTSGIDLEADSVSWAVFYVPANQGIYEWGEE